MSKVQSGLHLPGAQLGRGTSCGGTGLLRGSRRCTPGPGAPTPRSSSPKTRGDKGLQSPKGARGGARGSQRTWAPGETTSPPPLSLQPSKPEGPISHWGPPGGFPPGLSMWGVSLDCPLSQERPWWRSRDFRAQRVKPPLPSWPKTGAPSPPARQHCELCFQGMSPDW